MKFMNEVLCGAQSRSCNDKIKKKVIREYVPEPLYKTKGRKRPHAVPEVLILDEAQTARLPLNKDSDKMIITSKCRTDSIDIG